MLFQRLSMLLLLFAVAAAHGQARYISDELVITLRSGPSTRNSIIGNLNSGEIVDILEEDDDLGYSRVRLTASGAEGWVLSRYLSTEPAARDRLTEAESELAAADDRIADLEARLSALSDDLSDARGELTNARSTNSSMSSELEDIRSASANAITLRDQNDNFRRQVNELNQRVDLVAMENDQLRSRSRQNWFVVGAGVLFAGVVVGLVAPSLRRRRKTSW